MSTFTDGDDGSKTVLGSPTVTVWDMQRNEQCAWGTAEDGVRRCLPAGYSGTTVAYGDAACTVEARLVISGCAYTPAYFTETALLGCAAAMSLYSVGPEIVPPGPNWFHLVGTCQADPLHTTALYRGWQRGPKIPASAFQSGTLQTVNVP